MPSLHHSPRWLPRAVAAVGLPAGLFLICLGLGFTPQLLQEILLPAQGWNLFSGWYAVAGVALAWSTISYWASRDRHRLLLVLKPDTSRTSDPALVAHLPDSTARGWNV